MLAGAAEMEPGMVFRAHDGGPLLVWLGVERVVSRFPGKRRVRVLVKRGRSFVVDFHARFQVVAGG